MDVLWKSLVLLVHQKGISWFPFFFFDLDTSVGAKLYIGTLAPSTQPDLMTTQKQHPWVVSWWYILVEDSHLCRWSLKKRFTIPYPAPVCVGWDRPGGFKPLEPLNSKHFGEPDHQKRGVKNGGCFAKFLHEAPPNGYKWALAKPNLENPLWFFPSFQPFLHVFSDPHFGILYNWG